MASEQKSEDSGCATGCISAIALVLSIITNATGIWIMWRIMCAAEKLAAQ